MHVLVACADRQKIVPMAHGLDENVGAVEDERHGAGEDELRRAEGRAGRAREIRQDERENGERGENGERRTRALDLKSLLMVAHAADEKAKPDGAIADEHHRGENRIAREARLARRADHDGNDQGDFDDRHRDGEDKRAEGFADAMRDDFGVIDGGEDGADEARAGKRREEALRAIDDMPPPRRPRQRSGRAMPTRAAVLLRSWRRENPRSIRE